MVHPLQVCLHFTVPGVSWSVPLPPPLRVPGEGLPCDAVCRPAKDMSNPPPTSLTDVIFHWLLFSLLPQFLITRYLVWPMDFEVPSEAGVNKNLDLLYGNGGNSPGLVAIQQYRLHNGVENPDLGGVGSSWRKAVLALPLGILASASVPPMPVNYTAQVREKQSTPYSTSSPSVMVVLLAVLIFNTLLFSLLMLRPKLAEVSAMVFVFSCICCWVCERRSRSLAKSR